MDKLITETVTSTSLLQVFWDWVSGSGLTERSRFSFARSMSNLTAYKAVNQTEPEELSPIFSVLQFFPGKKK